MIAVGLYACGGGGSGSMMSSTPPSSSSPPPMSAPPDSVSVETVQTLTAAKVEDADPLTFGDGTVLAPSNDESSDPIVVDGQYGRTMSGRETGLLRCMQMR